MIYVLGPRKQCYRDETHRAELIVYAISLFGSGGGSHFTCLHVLFYIRIFYSMM